MDQWTDYLARLSMPLNFTFWGWFNGLLNARRNLKGNEGNLSPNFTRKTYIYVCKKHFKAGLKICPLAHKSFQQTVRVVLIETNAVLQSGLVNRRHTFQLQSVFMNLLNNKYIVYNTKCRTMLVQNFWRKNSLEL